MASSPDTATPRATALGAFLEGWRRVLGAPAITLGVLAVLFLLALPLTLALRGMLTEHLGSSVVSERVAWNWDAGWAAEFGTQAQGIGRTFTHEILGFGGTLSVISGFFDGRPLPPAIAAWRSRLPCCGPSSQAASSIDLRGDVPFGPRRSSPHAVCTSGVSSGSR